MSENLLFGFSVAIVGALVAILIAVSIAATRILAAMRKGRMLSACHGYGSEAMSQTGVSVVVSGAQSEREIEERLSSEYWRYEVIVVLDSTRDGRLLSRLCRKYSMIRVSFPTDGDLKIDGVPLLYRSRQRRYRRLVLIDRLHRSRADDWNCGVAIASFDCIIPLESDRFLTSEALPRWVMELHETRPVRSDFISAQVSPTHFFDRRRVAMFSRMAVVRAGGFSGEHPRMQMMRCLRGRTLCLPLAMAKLRRRRSSNPLRQLLMTMGALPTTLLFVSLAVRRWELARAALMLVVAVYVTALFISTIALRVRLALDEEYCEDRSVSLRRLLRCSFRVF